jgi:hypothetical protein
MERIKLGSGWTQDDPQVCSMPGRMKRRVIRDEKESRNDEGMWVWGYEQPCNGAGRA